MAGMLARTDMVPRSAGTPTCIKFRTAKEDRDGYALETMPEVDGPANSGFEKWFRMPGARKLAVRGLGHSSLAVTEIRYDAPNYGMTNPVINQDAFSIGLTLRPYDFHELWYEGKAKPVYGVKVGDALLFDLRTVQASRLTVPFNTASFFSPVRC